MKILFKATENALKVQISQLETTLKSDLNDKSRLTEALAREREAFAQMESDFKVFSSKTELLELPERCIQDLQSKFLAMKEDAEKQEDKLRYFAQVLFWKNNKREKCRLRIIWWMPTSWRRHWPT